MQFKIYKVLKDFLPSDGWIIFYRLNIIKGFPMFFLPLILQGVNLLFWTELFVLNLLFSYSIHINYSKQTKHTPQGLLHFLGGLSTSAKGDKEGCHLMTKILNLMLLLNASPIKKISLLTFIHVLPHPSLEISRSFKLPLLLPPGVKRPVPSPKPFWETLGMAKESCPAAAKSIIFRHKKEL